MEFVDEISKVKLVLSGKISDFYSEYMKSYDFKVESGGIIVGKLYPMDNKVVVTDVTMPFKKDCRGTNYFKRSEYGHQREMDRLWEISNKKKTYLGDWHTHRQDIPVPSNIDLKDWKRIEARERNCRYAFFIIVGQEEIKVWTISDGLVREMKEVKKSERK